jgi:MFS family permease
MQTVAESWLVLQLSGSAFDLGLVAAFRFVPVLILGLFGGVIADQLPKRPTLVATQVAQMLLAFTSFTLVATGVIQVWMICVLAFLLGCANAIDMPVRQSFVVEMVGRDDVANAVALNSAVFNGARVVGPAIAGLLIGAVGTAMCFLLNGLSFIAVIVGLLMMRDEELRPAVLGAGPKNASQVLSNLADGLRYVWRTPAVLLPIAMVGLVSTFALNFSVSVPDMIQDALDSDAAGYGFLMASTGLGCVVAALAIAATGRASTTLLLGGAVTLSVLFTAFGLSESFALSMVLMFGVGAGLIAMSASANTLIQLTVPDHLRGRVMSVYTTLFARSTPVGAIATGAMASAYGIAAAVTIGGVLSIAVALGGVLYAMRHPDSIRTTAAEAVPA